MTRGVAIAIGRPSGRTGGMARDLFEMTVSRTWSGLGLGLGLGVGLGLGLGLGLRLGLLAVSRTASTIEPTASRSICVVCNW